MPEHATDEEDMDAYIEGWKHGLKALAIYRDGSKKSQPLNTSKDAKLSTSPLPDPSTSSGSLSGVERESGQQSFSPSPLPEGGQRGVGDEAAAIPVVAKANGEAVKVLEAGRRKLPDERLAITHKFEISGHEGYITVGLFPDGKPGELFIKMNKEGSTLSGLMDAFSILVSFNLQYGVPLEFLVNKFTHMRFEPAGMTKNKQIPFAKSIVDYVFRYLAVKFLDKEQAEQIHSSVSPAESINTANDIVSQAQPKVTAQQVEIG